MSQSLERKENIGIIAHFFEIVYGKIGIHIIIELLAAIKQRFKLNFLGHFQIFAQSVHFVLLELTSVSDSEGIPVDDLDLEHSVIDSVSFLFALLLIELLSFAGLFTGGVDILHADNFCKDYVVSILVGVFNSVEQSD